MSLVFLLETTKLVMVALFKPQAHWPGDSRELPPSRAPAAYAHSLLKAGTVRRAGFPAAGRLVSPELLPCPAASAKARDASAHRPAPDPFDVGLATSDSWWVWVSEGRGSSPCAGSRCCRRIHLARCVPARFGAPTQHAWPGHRLRQRHMRQV